jgi:hypothetical protein
MNMNHAAPWGTLRSMDGNDDVYWRSNLNRQPFYFDGLSYDDYAPALRLGHTRFREDTLFEDVQCRLGSEWEEIKGKSRLAWFEARHATRAAWERASSLVRGRSTQDKT